MQTNNNDDDNVMIPLDNNMLTQLQAQEERKNEGTEQEQEQEQQQRIIITGLIASRRCHGKYLSFATLLLSVLPQHGDDEHIEHDNDTDKDAQQRGGDKKIKVVFRRAHFEDGQSNSLSDKSATFTAKNNHDVCLCHPLAFPTKASDLPFGMRVQMCVVKEPEQEKESSLSLTNGKGIDSSSAPAPGLLYEVRWWDLVGEHPRQKAMQMAAAAAVSINNNNDPKSSSVVSVTTSNTALTASTSSSSNNTVTTASTAISCTDYFRARRGLFSSVAQHQYGSDRKKEAGAQNEKELADKAFSSSIAKPGNDVSSNPHIKNDVFNKNNNKNIINNNNNNNSSSAATIEFSPHHHGSGGGGSNRAKIFAEWLVENLPLLRGCGERGDNADNNNNNNNNVVKGVTIPTVLDVAGGKGMLSVELGRLGVACTVVDPMIRSKRSLRRLDKSRREGIAITNNIPSFVAARFELDKNTDEMVKEYSCLVGFHPDECTETIVDMALRHDKVFAIVPCCVFPSLFPGRKFQNGNGVQSYDEFLDYLLQKDPRMKRASLPIQGKNQIIYMPTSK